MAAVLVVNELRSQTVHARFLEAFEPTHNIKIIPLSKMDETYQHPNIQIFHMKKRRLKKPAGKQAEGSGDDQEDEQQGAGVEEAPAVGGGAVVVAEALATLSVDTGQPDDGKKK